MTGISEGCALAEHLEKDKIDVGAMLSVIGDRDIATDEALAKELQGASDMDSLAVVEAGMVCEECGACNGAPERTNCALGYTIVTLANRDSA